MNKIWTENCISTLDRFIKDGERVDYVFTIPPDFEELEIDPDDRKAYYQFLRFVLEKCSVICPQMTVGLTDRKHKGRIIAKHEMVLRVMRDIGWKLITYKIWHKSPKINLYRLNFLHLMSFAKDKPKQNHPRSYRYDVFTDPLSKYQGYSYGIPVEVVEPFILNFTLEREAVYDPFMGSGTTGLACVRHQRFYLGSEINSDVAEMARRRIKAGQ